MTQIEQGYVIQGYELPDGWNWADVAIQRLQYEVADIYVPVACGPGVVALGAPMCDGKFLSHAKA